ncbi:unnamed protein product [Cunninghamella blakesleeana]
MPNFLNRRSWVTRSGTVSPINQLPPPMSTNKKRPLSEFVQKQIPQSSSVNVLIPSLSQLNLIPPTTLTPSNNTNNNLYVLDSSLTSSSTSSSSTFSTSSFPNSPISPENESLDFTCKNNNTTFELPPPEFACSLPLPYPSTFDYVIPATANILHGIQPVKMLLERLETWDYIARCLHNQFEILALAEVQYVKAYQKLDGVLDFENNNNNDNNIISEDNDEHTNDNQNDNQNDNNNNDDDHPLQINNHLPLQQQQQQKNKKSNQYSNIVQSQFNKTGGIRQICDVWQSYHIKSAKDHSDYASFIQNRGLSLLTNIKHELKTIIKSIRSNDRLSIAPLLKLKDEASRRLHKLAQQLAYFDRYPDYGSTKEDPWLINTRVVKQIMKVYQQENKMHEAIVRLQREVMTLEKQIVEELRHFFTELYKLREASSLGADRGMEQLLQIVNQVANDQDWIYFSEHCKNQLISENAAYRHPEKLQYPNHSHPLAHPLFVASMERRSSVLHNWSEYFYVLTPAGFLHEYRNTKSYPSHPTSTIFVPEYDVSTLSSKIHHHDLTFQLQPRSSSSSINQPIEMMNGKELQPFQQPSLKKNSKSRKNITLRAKCANDMQIWLEHLTKCSQKFIPKIQFRQPPIINNELDDDHVDDNNSNSSNSSTNININNQNSNNNSSDGSNNELSTDTITSPQSIHEEMATSHGTLSPVIAYPMTPRPGTYILKSPTFASMKSPTFSTAMKSSPTTSKMKSPSTKNFKSSYGLVNSKSQYLPSTSK